MLRKSLLLVFATLLAAAVSAQDMQPIPPAVNLIDDTVPHPSAQAAVTAVEESGSGPVLIDDTATPEVTVDPAAERAAERAEAISTLEQLRAGITNAMTGGYRGQLISEEEIGGQLARKEMMANFRMRPRAIRLEMTSPDEQVVVWQQGWDTMSVDRPWLPALNIDPAGERAMATSHRPLTQFGIDLTIDRYIDAMKATPEDAEVTVSHAGTGPVDRQQLDRWDFTHPRVGNTPVTEFTIWIDTATGMPVHFENRKADGSVYERYRYTDFELNPRFDRDTFEK
jgi:hypothetical protein